MIFDRFVQLVNQILVETTKTRGYLQKDHLGARAGIIFLIERIQYNVKYDETNYDLIKSIVTMAYNRYPFVPAEYPIVMKVLSNPDLSWGSEQALIIRAFEELFKPRYDILAAGGDPAMLDI